ncbi:MAG: hypothetical protein RL685_5597 [Pseudomonadota bacterium]|jgi:hypothetical protein
MFKRLFHAMVLFFAVYAFVFVPLGQKTALEHLRAIAGTPAAKDAATELTGGVKRLAHSLRDEARRATEAVDEQIASEEPAAGSPPAESPPSKAATDDGATGDNASGGTSGRNASWGQGVHRASGQAAQGSAAPLSRAGGSIQRAQRPRRALTHELR